MSRRFAFPSMGESRRNRAWAAGISLCVHLALVCYLWPWSGHAGSQQDSKSGEGTTSFTVSFVAVPQSKVSAETKATKSDDGVAKPTAAEATDPSAQKLSLSLQLPVSTNGQLHEQSTAERASAATHAAEASAAANQVPAGSSGVDDAEARYIAAIRQAVLSQWLKTTGHSPAIPCTLDIKQLAGGKVLSASSEPCDLSESDRRALEAAALMVQPLPYAGFESVFRPDIQVDFRAD